MYFIDHLSITKKKSSATTNWTNETWIIRRLIHLPCNSNIYYKAIQLGYESVAATI